MLRYIILLLVVPFLANCWEETLHDGPCPPAPRSEKKSEWDKIPGKWWFEAGNREYLKDNPLSCGDIVLKYVEDDVLDVYLTYNDNDGAHIKKQRLEPMKDKSNRLISKVLNATTNKYEEDGWIYSWVKIADGGILDYACMEVGDKHKNFYHFLLSKDVPFSSEDEADFTRYYEDTGDKRDMITLKHNDCNQV